MNNDVMQVYAELISTTEFWEKMGDIEFVRMSDHLGKICDKYYTVLVAPEDEPGFIERKINETCDAIGISRNAVTRRQIEKMPVCKSRGITRAIKDKLKAMFS